MIDKFIIQFTRRKILNEKDLLIVNDKYFLVSEKIRETINIIKREPHLAGLYLGRQRGNQFFPSVALLAILHPFAENIITLNDDAAFLFICGRDIYAPSILKMDGRCAESSIVILQNKNKELLGFGKRAHPITSQQPVVENIFDIGDFLRRENKR
ncbi:hypothetical protein J4457_01390 [Candidatus Woesearchaeota archaeon]|nr:hypothetical protein [Candidatus Woesearchaeota archaeon]